MGLTPRAHVIGFVLCAAALIAAFGRPLLTLAIDAAHSDLNSYIFLVPFVSGYLIYIRRNQLPEKVHFSPGMEHHSPGGRDGSSRYGMDRERKSQSQ